jgi:hypothetical protein
MQILFGCVMVVCASGAAPPAGPLDELFAGWGAARGKAESLAVEFALETWDRALDERVKAKGTFRLIRTKGGEVLASYEVVRQGRKGKEGERVSILLTGKSVYFLDHDKNTATRFESPNGAHGLFLEEYVNPFVVLLDRERAEASCTLKVVKQDDWYTYLSVKPKKVKRRSWLSPVLFHEGRVVLTRKGSVSVPKGMPRQMWYANGLTEYRLDVKSWRLNGTDAPKPEEFARPEDRPDWEVKAPSSLGKR